MNEQNRQIKELSISEGFSSSTIWLDVLVMNKKFVMMNDGKKISAWLTADEVQATNSEHFPKLKTQIYVALALNSGKNFKYCLILF